MLNAETTGARLKIFAFAGNSRGPIVGYNNLLQYL
tara:strand:+ start:206 stop:310 length:105 start_codon:yes stop_codon:yes gene_type:complete